MHFTDLVYTMAGNRPKVSCYKCEFDVCKSSKEHYISTNHYTLHLRKAHQIDADAFQYPMPEPVPKHRPPIAPTVVSLDDESIQNAFVCAGCFMSVTMTNATTQAAFFEARPADLRTFPLVALLHESAATEQ